MAVGQATAGAHRVIEDLHVAPELVDFIELEAIPGTGVDVARFWTGLSELVNDFAPRNRELLARRADLQHQIDDWHRTRTGQPHEAAAYRLFLEEIGYLVPEGPDFQIETDRVDAEIARLAGPQLVVPLTNARYALNAANARWGSLYDALYGTDAIGEPPASGDYDAERGARVVRWVRRFLDDSIPLDAGSYVDAATLSLHDGQLQVRMGDGRVQRLAEPDQLRGYRGGPDAPSALLFEHHGLGIELVIDRTHRIGQADLAGIADVVLEAALTTIMDFEDSIAAVDVADKVHAYRNWLGLMKGDLREVVTKAGVTFDRVLAPDREFTSPIGDESVVRPGRSVLLVRNVGHLMTTPAVLDREGEEAYEGLLDAAVTVLCALHDIHGTRANSAAGAVYVVKPKLHGPDEVRFTDDVFGRVEAFLGLADDTVKIGLMDEERRTSLNLRECIHAARRRLAFINTGFLDRTGDEVHSSMHAGPMVRKHEMRAARWMTAYEQRNVAVGLRCGLAGRAQIGKGMWASPDQMALMLSEKVAHPGSGSTCAWVPSPTAATLHATHYHRVDVGRRQRELAADPAMSIDDLLTLPLADRPYSPHEVQAELDNNLQGILGYVVRWVDSGIGCSKVPDIRGIALMEDRATCRISAQLTANWLQHAVVSEDQVLATMRRMAEMVDEQNREADGYEPMGPAFDGPAFNAACELVLTGAKQPCGYTEPILHHWRTIAKHDARGAQP